jgi:geranylgeranyl reductase family protein
VSARFDVIIVGAGPAGAAAALELARRRPHAAHRVLVLDRAIFPRHKLCGGGLVRRAEDFLVALEVDATVPSVVVDVILTRLGGRAQSQRQQRLFRVVRREELDFALLRAAAARGVVTREGEAVRALTRLPDAIGLTMSNGDRLLAAIVIGADGARSHVRRALLPQSSIADVRRFVALEILTPGHDDPNTARFDFSPIDAGLSGYAWHFPSLIHGAPYMNRGIAATGRTPGASLRTHFREHLSTCGIELDAHSVQGAFAPIYDPRRRVSAERVLLAGDAVGVDPFVGEGISGALGMGLLAGIYAARALQTARFDFSDYSDTIASSRIGTTMAAAAHAADRVYSSRARSTHALAAR